MAKIIKIPNNNSFDKVYQFKVSLIDTDVWHVIQLPKNYSFYD